jgi:hypothetical protein
MLDSPQWSAHAGRASSVLRRMGQAFRGCVGACMWCDVMRCSGFGQINCVVEVNLSWKWIVEIGVE